ncbi:hypothetical protein UCRNP2_90 [Neofusicoccum parvum UCRNP2]|uniref:Uncharacterized protein n=1 Tax=Botryosphaeria parva (strain UCR-NP2) TaxID=1287680 RepID=R1H3V3_BOTPV|nr:hypothetical protein UCRNP2_90 [Neofusicoccum parvum UCRNP2]
MALVKTYLLAPTFAFRPTGPIALGTIIADPFAPHRALTTADPGAPSPPIDTVVELDRTIHRSTSRAARLGLWAQFLASVGGGGGAERGCDASAESAMAALRTVCYREEPGEEEIRARVAAPRLLEIGLKGWREKTVRVNEFRPKACFLGDEEDEEEESDVEVETSAATAKSLLKPGRKDVVLEMSEVQDGEERCFCIAARST